MISQNQLTPDLLSFNSGIAACGANWRCGLEILSAFEDARAQPDVISCNAAMRSCVRGGAWQQALGLMEAMEKLRVTPDAITCSVALSGLAQADLALELLAQAAAAGVQLDCQVYTGAMAVCSRASRWEEALGLFAQTGSGGRRMSRDAAAYNAAITAAGAGRKWEAALDLLAASGSGDPIAGSAALKACCDASQWQVAVALLAQHMEDPRLLRAASFNTVLAACSWEAALALLQEMDARRVEKDSLTFSTASMVCEQSGRWSEAFQLLSARLGSEGRLRRRPFAPRTLLAQLAPGAGRRSELRRLLRSCAREATSVVRVNGVKASRAVVEELRKKGRLSPVPWSGSGFFVRDCEGDKDLSWLQLTGELYFQEATSQLPAELLKRMAEGSEGGARSDPGKATALSVLDLCAAPGSKSTQLGSWLMERGPKNLLVANEPKEPRARKLQAALLRLGVVNCLATGADGRALGDLAPEAFDAVLADVPCSCEGNVRKDATSMLRGGAADEGPLMRQELLECQRQLLLSAWRALKPGGCLVYSTCTFSRWENADQVQLFLAAVDDAEPVDVGEVLGLGPAGLSGFQILPHTFNVEGFFVSCFRKRKREDSEGKQDVQEGGMALAARRGLRVLGPSEAQEVQSLAEEVLGFWPGEGGDGEEVLAESSEGEVWLLPPVGPLAVLADVALVPGLLVARRAGADGPWELTADLALLAGTRGKVRRSRQEWTQMLAAKEAGGQWSPSRSQRRTRNLAIAEAAK
ncbi:unnamed protein product [Effrenium voratum]|nr:unnamed protein product [Effrenium voratum]